MLKPTWIIAFAGHRELADEPRVREALLAVLGELKERIIRQGGQPEVYSSIAAGSDVLFVEVARELQLPVHLILPLDEDEFAKDFKPLEWERSVRQIEATRASGGTVRVANAARTRPACYFDTGAQMLEACDVLVTVWDGQPAQGAGGTADIAQQAQRLGLPLVWIHSQTGAIQQERLPEIWPITESIFGELRCLAERTEPCACPFTDVDALTSCLEAIAKKKASRFRWGIVSIISFHLIAAVLATLADVFHSIPAEWVLIASALVLSWLLHRYHTQRKWMIARFARELVRSLEASVGVLDPLHPLISHHAPDWRKFVVSAGLLIRTQRARLSSLAEVKAAYVRDRLDDQIAFFEREGTRARLRGGRIRFAAELCALAALLVVSLSLINEYRHLGWERPPTKGIAIALKFMPVALPLLAGAMTAIYYTLDVNRRRERYPQMAGRLKAEKIWLEGLTTESSVKTAIAGCEEFLLDEVTEWEVIARTSDVH